MFNHTAHLNSCQKLLAMRLAQVECEDKKNPKLQLQYWFTTIRALFQNQTLLYGLQISGVIGNDFMSLNTTMPTTSTEHNNIIEHNLSWGNFQQKMVQATTNIFRNYPTTEFQISILPGPRSSPSAISGWDPEMLRKLERRFSFQATTCKQQFLQHESQNWFRFVGYLASSLTGSQTPSRGTPVLANEAHAPVKSSRTRTSCKSWRIS